MVKRRVLVGAAVFARVDVAIEARLIYLQVVSHADLTSRAERQQQRTITAPAKRGEISIGTAVCSRTASTPTRFTPFLTKSRIARKPLPSCAPCSMAATQGAG